MADNELRQRRANTEIGETRKKERAARIYKIEGKPEPTNWCLIISIILFVLFILFIIIDAFSQFRRIKYIFGIEN
ncbi:unnamed protein product [Caenorhabditis angaria]|uniref:Stress-associated endoplasmic reticulum protein n=1 Tax=Caenorhabditis angaria TaxID=860376 RepID=A0A9P1N9U4_9PELO|nr:unnamed protein product [Caenorhabditis angaria]